VIIQFEKLSLALACAGALAIAGCGGGGGGSGGLPGGTGGTPVPTAAVSGVVADGLISGATVCYDLNDNGRCDDDEPKSTETGVDGGYTLSVPAAEAGKHAVIAVVPATAIDQDNPGTPVGVAFTLKAPAQADASLPVFVSPLTDAVVQLMAAAGTNDPAAAIEQLTLALGLTLSPLDNFIEMRSTGTAEEQAAAQLAATYAQVLTELKKNIGEVAAGAGVPTDQTEALISVTVFNTIGTLAASVAANTGTSADLAQTLVAAQGIDATTVATQAEVATVLTQSTPDTTTATATPTPFVTVRDLRYTDASNWSYRLFTGDDVADSTGAKFSNEIRERMAGGARIVFNRDVSYFDEAVGKWYECPSDGYQVTKSITTNGVTESLFCRTFADTGRRTNEDVSGKTVRSVLERVRGSGIGNYATWGADPAIVPADATFPAGSVLRLQINTQSKTPDSHSLSSKIRVLPDGRGPTDSLIFNLWPFAATLEKMISRNYGSFTTVLDNDVTGNISLNIATIDDASVTDPTLQKKGFYRVAFQSTGPAAGIARYFLCRRNDSAVAPFNTNTRTCERVNDGGYTIETRADARVMRLSGIPPIVTAFTGASQLYVERGGAVFSGSKALLQTSTTFRLNKAAWDTLRPLLPGVTAHVDPTAPVSADARKRLRDFRDLGAGAFSYRLNNNSGTTGGTLDEIRVRKDGLGGAQPFARNTLYWNPGTGAWVDAETLCPSNGVAFGTWTSNPRESVTCGLDRFGSTSFDVSIAGRTLLSVIDEARLYSSRDNNGQVASNWGPTLAAGATDVFPAGSELRYQVAGPLTAVDTIASTVTISFGGTPLTDLGGLSNFNGGFAGTTGAPGNTLNLFTYSALEEPAPGTTGQKRVRASFEATGPSSGNANFFVCDVSDTAPNPVINCVASSSTTYAITQQGGKNMLRFASQAPEVAQIGGFERTYVEHAGTVMQGSRSIPGTKNYSLRLNEAAYTAIFSAINETPPAVTLTAP